MYWEKIFLRKVKQAPSGFDYDAINISVALPSSSGSVVLFPMPFIYSEKKTKKDNIHILFSDFLTQKMEAAFLDLTENYHHIDEIVAHEVVNVKKKKNLEPEIPAVSQELYIQIQRLKSMQKKVPVGIRIPANFIERDIILAQLYHFDFVIFNCSDSIQPENIETSLIPSLPTIVRANKMKQRLYPRNFSFAISQPSIHPSHYLKLFAMGVNFIHFEDQYLEEEKINFYLKNDILCKLKEDILSCGQMNLSDVDKKNMLTTSARLSNKTGISNVFTSDLVNIPIYKMNRNR